MFDFFRNYIIVTCGNYLKIVVKYVTKAKARTMLQLGTMYIHAIMPCAHISTTHYGIHLQLIFDCDTH